MNNYDQGYADRKADINSCSFIEYSEEYEEWFSGWYEADYNLWWEEYRKKEFWEWMESGIHPDKIFAQSNTTESGK